MEKQTKLLNAVIETLYYQDEYLDSNEKREFPLISRAASTVLDVWSSNREKLEKINIEARSSDTIRIEVNDCPPVVFMSQKATAAYGQV